MRTAALEACSVLVEASGPDPRLVKASFAPFHEAKDGITTLSASGTLLLNPSAVHQLLVVLPAIAVFPFLRQAARDAFPAVVEKDLVPGARFKIHAGSSCCDAHFRGAFTIAPFLAAQQHLLNSSHEWQAGRLSSPGSVTPAGSHSYPPAVHASLAVLEMQAQLPEGAEAAWRNGEHPNEQLCQGQQVWACGTPFGSMSPRHFHSCCVGGCIANSIPCKDGAMGLHLLDLYSLPGMEGCPVADSSGAIIGLLGPVLSHTTFQAQVSTLMPAAAVLLSLRQWHQQSMPAKKLERTPVSAAWPALSGCTPHQQHAVQLPSQIATSVMAAALPAGSTARNEEDASFFELPAISDTEPHKAAQLRRARNLSTQPCRATHSRSLPACEPSLRAGSWQEACLTAKQFVVGVHVPGSVWASGIVASATGIIVTNAHVWSGGAPGSGAQGLPAAQVQLSPRGAGAASWHTARTLYRFSGPLDIAVLLVEDTGPLAVQPAALRDTEPCMGEPVAVVGHPLMHPQLGLGASAMQGNVARVVRDRGGRGDGAMIISTAPVHPGSSGGALIDADGQLVGLVTSNTRHAHLGSFPSLNFSIASTQLCPVWQAITQYCHQPDVLVKRLTALDVRSESLERVWQLGDFVAPHQHVHKSADGMTPPLVGLQRLLKKVSQDRPYIHSRL